jgi:signal transduction histidine kinase
MFHNNRPPWWPQEEGWPPQRRPWGRRRMRPFGLVPFLLFIGLAVLLGHFTNGWIFVLILAGVLAALFAGLMRAQRSAAVARRRLRAAETEGANRKSFLADVTHELRTPLAVIRGQAEAISDGVYATDAEHLQPILDATATLERLVEDLRTVSLSEAGQLELHYETVDLAELAADVVQAHRSLADDAGVALASDGGAAQIEADAIRLRGVLTNLVTNSLKHTPSGGHVSISVSGNGDGARITVQDDGEGVPADLQPRVFDRFAKGEGSSGSGLGLAIAKDIVEAHGGTISLTSPPGTTIAIELPNRRPEN